MKKMMFMVPIALVMMGCTTTETKSSLPRMVTTTKVAATRISGLTRQTASI